MDEERKESNGKKKRIIGTIALTVSCLVLGVVISLYYKGLTGSGVVSRSQADTLADYQTQILNLSDRLDTLKKENDELTEKLSLLEAGNSEEQIENLKKELERLKTFAGLTTVTGEGVRISLSFPEGASLEAASSAIQMLINEIKASDAQAISVNGERLVSTSEVRVVNTYFVVNGRIFSQPLELLVIGRQSSLNSMLNMSGGIISVLRNDYGAEIEIVNMTEVTIEAYTGSTEMNGVK